MPSTERADNKCERCGKGISFSGDTIDLILNELICSSCWKIEDKYREWNAFVPFIMRVENA